MKSRVVLKTFTALVVCATLAGCASTRPVQYSEITSSQLLRPNPSDKTGRMPYAYAAKANWRGYTGAIIEPVAIYGGADAQFEKVDERDKQELAQYMYSQFRAAVGERYPIANRAGPGILRVQLTLTGAKPNKAVISTFTKFDMAGLPYNTVQSIRGKEGLMVGSVSYVIEVYDSATGEVLLAYVAKQYPNAMNVKASVGALAASRTGIKKGAKDLLERMQ
ncbi:MAG: DUF3313 domain-containing protein [Pseudoxanthomonas sp.]